MSNTTWHPTEVQLDQLRAGLIDVSTADGSGVQQHVRDCRQCQQYLAGWDQLRGMLAQDRAANAQITARLAAARRGALNNPARTARRLTQPALAIAAGVLLGVSLLLWQPWSSFAPPDQQVVQADEDTVPEAYEDLDFYLWLAGRNESSRMTKPFAPDKA